MSARRKTAAGLVAQAVLACSIAVVAPQAAFGRIAPVHIAGGALAGIVLFALLTRGGFPPATAFAASWAQILAIAGIGACEEIIWRGWLFSLASQAGWIAAFVVTTIGFAAMHAFTQAQRGIATHLVTGSVFGALRILTGSTAASIAAHALYNVFIAASRHRIATRKGNV